MSAVNKFIGVDYLFRGKENRITSYIESGCVLKLEIEDKESGNEWSGSFMQEYIEELTRKTGNFKTFEVFVAMIQTVLVENSDSLSLDLMTFSDLEELRKLKLGSVGINKNALVNNADVSRQNRRYLILTYTTDFDKIHYPLPLTFQGISDIRKLKDTILDLRQKIYGTKQNTAVDLDQFEVSELKKRIIQLKTENDQLTTTLNKYKNHLHNVDFSDDTKKELKNVKSIIRSLEEELVEEKAKHQRILMKKNQEIKSLTDEVLELKAEKRNLHFRVNNLTNELSIYKRQRIRSGTVSPRPPVCPLPKSSLDILASNSKRLSNSLRQSRQSPLIFSDPETRTSHKSRRALSSLSDGLIPRNNVRRCSSADRYRMDLSNCASRFDPTAYVQKQHLKRQEIQDKRQREIRYRINSGNCSDRSRDSSPASFRPYKSGMRSLKSSLLSSSNASSTSDLDEKGKDSINTSKYRSKHRTTPINDTDDALSMDSGSVSQRYKPKGRKYQNGYKSDDSSTNDYEENDSRLSGKMNQHQPRRLLLDSDGDDASEKRLRLSKNPKKSADKSRLKSTNKHHSVTYENQKSDINDIDRRLNALQEFFQKYLHDE